jgi:hypothetical protein
VRDLVEQAARVPTSVWAPPDFAEKFPKLARALERDGFVVQESKLRKALPTALG